ncbi:protein ARV1 [Hermetia illucens]|nr:protein ARV1 [Hermetia illucens]
MSKTKTQMAKSFPKVTSTTAAKLFVCINCGAKVKELYKTYSSSVIKIIKCDECHEVADKYIEFEPIIILVDLVLLSQSAYRHVLYNTDFKLHWKLSLVLLLLESFALWRQKLSNFSDIGNKEDFLEERGFYICCLENIIDNFMIFVILQIISIFLRGTEKKKNNRWDWSNEILLCKTITIANLGKFLLLPIMIWKDNTTEFGLSIHYLLVMGYFLLSFIHVYSVVTNMSKFKAFFVIIFTFMVKHYINGLTTTYLETNYL